MVAKKTAVQQPATGKTGARPATRKTAAGNTAVKNTAVKNTAVKNAAGKKTAGKKTAVEEAPAKKAVAKKAATKKAATKQADSGKTVTRKAAGGKAATGKAPTEGTAAKRTAAKKTAAKRTAAGKSTAKKAGAARAAKQTGATTVVAKKTPGTATAAQSPVPKARVAAAEPGDLAVRPGEDPWTPEEVEEARAELQSEMERLREEISSSEASLVGLMRDSGDGAGDDQADTGTKNITREHELALAANARETLTQTERALERLDAGTYGLCENCGNPIGKARMQAFPRATLCVECKQKQERRS
ncbi:TraR/DksA C4-type zinc finger protein [Streptomyces actinomycinicus]|uniref:TraR/DksA C4-type zinc finger protein n=1 Tax=Streptomyces actinomycinicus TaxID=1695166 RepID=A0A937EME7_9ACTN|nr:TraR/DksA C4-type zinc finger protein [Streptomyces actinomycinicus]MBL1084751.1 TraR/DksA C4-type zinc finger protein [Streptomyces actinomycinicus]